MYIFESKKFQFSPQVGHIVTRKPLSFRCHSYLWEDRRVSQENIKKLSHFMWIWEEKICIVNQTHSNKVVCVNQDNYTQIHEADASVTNMKWLLLCTLASDCVPMLLFDPVQNAIWSIHAWWKGLESNIIENTIANMQSNYSSKPEDIIVYIWACISGENYEVWVEVADRFQDRYPESLRKSQENSEKFFLDIRYIANQQLLHLGIWDQNIENSKYCTYAQRDVFHSYRRKTHFSEREYGNNLFWIYLK